MGLSDFRAADKATVTLYNNVYIPIIQDGKKDKNGSRPV
ncbi:hypothetical protein ALCH109712_09720 [Alkalicoccus chagannorensis]